MEYDEYQCRRNEFLKIRDESFDFIDKHILLAFSTGSLSLSITFLDKIGKPYDGNTYLLILFFWLSMLVVVISLIGGFIFAIKNADWKIKELNEIFHRSRLCGNDSESDSPYKKWIIRSNRSALFFSFLGISLFIIYASLIQYNQLPVKEKSKVVTTINHPSLKGMDPMTKDSKNVNQNQATGQPVKPSTPLSNQTPGRSDTGKTVPSVNNESRTGHVENAKPEPIRSVNRPPKP